MDSWRLIEHGPANAYWNMAVDEAILRSFSASETPATVRFYAWDSPAISLGRFQDAQGAVDRALCNEAGIAVVRRPTGGRAVFHGTDLTFTIVKENDGRSVAESYRALGEAVAAALNSIGISAAAFAESSDRDSMRAEVNCFNLKTRFEVGIGGRKALGSAQFRTERAILQQNSLILERMPADNHNAFAGDRPTECAYRAAGADREAVIHALRAAVGLAFGTRLEDSGLSEKEETAAEELVRLKYGTDAWNLKGVNPHELIPARKAGK